MAKFTPTDVVAIIVIVGGFILKFTGADGLVGSLLTAVVFYYFGTKTFYDNAKNRQFV